MDFVLGGKGALYHTHQKPFRIMPSVIMPLSLVVLSLILPIIMISVGVPLTLRSSFGRIKDIVAWGCDRLADASSA